MGSSRLVRWRTSCPSTMKMTISARLVVWSAMRSRYLAIDCRRVARYTLWPLSIMNVMDSMRGTQEMIVQGESSVNEAATAPLDYVVAGAQVLTITIK